MVKVHLEIQQLTIIVIKLNPEFKLKNITKIDYPFLYDLLKERDPRANISHKKMPTYDEHVKFVMSKPYSKWYVIQYKNQNVGSIYLSKQNEIGIFIRTNMQGRGIGEIALELLMKYDSRPIYLANVSPQNKRSMKFFEKNGFKLIQHTYELDNHKKFKRYEKKD
jgi:RimJ/RimL family protein N-acetyltransferase